MFKINLVPEIQKKQLETKKKNRYATIFGIGLVSVIVFGIILVEGFQLVRATQLSGIKKDIAETQKEVDTYKELEQTVLSLQNGLEGAKKALDGTNHWTKLLDHMEKATPADVAYNNVKFSNGSVEATVLAASVNSLAKMVESYKNYQVISLTGTGTEETPVKVTQDGTGLTDGRVKSDGTWTYAISFDPAADHTFVIETGNKKVNLTYKASTKELSSSDSSVRAEVKNLFSSVEAPSYDKRDGKIQFTLKFNFDGKAIW